MNTWPDLQYSPALGEAGRLDLYVPKGPCRGTMLWFHGGGLEGGSRKDASGMAPQLAAAGIALASAEYRMYPAARFPQFLQDGAQAAAWLLKKGPEYGAGGPVFLGGSSAGAYISMMLCFAREYLEAEGCAPEDFKGYFFNAGQPTTHFNVLRERGEDCRRCVVDSAAPLFHIRDSRPGRPIQILYADGDMPARPEQNQLLRATLEQFGYDRSLVAVECMQGYGHCGYDEAIRNGRWLLADRIEQFVQRALGEEKKGKEVLKAQ